MEKKILYGLIGLAILAIVSGIILGMGWLDAGMSEIFQSSDGGFTDHFQWAKNIMIWFMLMLVAFLMIFIKKFEWGVCLAVLLSAAGSYIVYLFIVTTFGSADGPIFWNGVWDETLMIRAVICAITVVIAIGVFLGTCKMWQYLLVGALFAPVYVLVECFISGGIDIGLTATDPGGSILVHMCAAYFGLGVCLALRNKKAFNEPMYTTTHSVSFVWLASMLLWVLWPAFVTSLLPGSDVAWGTLTCYLAGLGSIISAYIVCMVFQGKVNPLTYTYAMLAGPVAIGAALLVVGPWGALLIGILAGAVSAFCFIYLQPWFCSKLGVLDVMGVHNLHGMAGWIGALITCVIVGAIDNAVFAVITVAITLCLGAVIGLIVRFTMGKEQEICDDEPDFIRNDEPGKEFA